MNNDIPVIRSSMPSYEEYCEQIKSIWSSRRLTNSGPLHTELSLKLCEYLSAGSISLFTNGHMGLELCLQAMELEGEVITTPFTFISTTQAIIRNGLTPVFCDIDEHTLTIDPAKIESLITEKTSAIVAVHVYGTPCDVGAIKEIAEKHRLKVIYDAAHCFGERLCGSGIAEFGDASMFSLHATKVFHTVEGGAICSNDAELIEKLDHIKNFGLTSEEEAEYRGANAKLSEFHAAMGLCNLRHIDEYLESRRQAALWYDERLSGENTIALLPRINGLERNYGYYPIVLKSGYKMSRDELFTCLRDAGIYTRKYFYPLISRLACMNGFDPGNTPIAEKAANSVLCLPMYEGLTKADIDRVCDIICKR